MSYYDEDFKPWQIVDGQSVVADKPEWERLAKHSKDTRYPCKNELLKRSGERGWKDQGDETMMLSIDAERSCRLLDGQEHNGRVS